MRFINGKTFKLSKCLIDPTIIKYLKFINNNLLKNYNKNYIKLQIISIKILNDITKSYSISIINKLKEILISTWKLMLFYQKENVKMLIMIYINIK